MTDQAMSPLRRRSIFALGQVDRARTSATFREILDAMWLLNAKFEQALSKFDGIKARQGSNNLLLSKRFRPALPNLTCDLFPVAHNPVIVV